MQIKNGIKLMGKNFKRFLEERKLKFCTDKTKVLVCDRRGREQIEKWK